MLKAPPEVNFKATAVAFFVYCVGMGSTGVYWSEKCGPHWFMEIVTFSVFTLPVLLIIWAASTFLILKFKIGGRTRYWGAFGILGLLIFIGCFVFAHRIPDSPFYDPVMCAPW